MQGSRLRCPPLGKRCKVKTLLTSCWPVFTKSKRIATWENVDADFQGQTHTIYVPTSYLILSVGKFKVPGAGFRLSLPACGIDPHGPLHHRVESLGASAFAVLLESRERLPSTPAYSATVHAARSLPAIWIPRNPSPFEPPYRVSNARLTNKMRMAHLRTHPSFPAC